ncbi:gamma-aminobutyraldehyde dehydrogenase [Mycetocola miduiensis]|uniref:Salicylaldehyde dehydrogenase n=1 Tax=Mycetocola miduiensis TaxID=995034 RepID=A0A1I4YK79_9MICO|nr:gamma-aminobutyraldehyde dehydrogenase [Mycetocola miduiensis]SFN38424.1 aldehyde dehydrogenase (NAD+) [Mycetocola miduiensis]
MTSLQNYINGSFVDAAGSETIDVVSPATGDVVTVSPVSTDVDVDAAFGAARTAFTTWKRTTPSQRQGMLLQIADAMEANADELVEAQHRNTGQPREAIRVEEVITGADHLRFFAGAARVLEGKSAGEYLEGHTSWIRREPIGVVAQVTPWNYPLMMAIWKIAPALAAGNTVVLKPSDTTPESTLVLARLTQGILPDGVLNVILGNASTGQLMTEHPVPGLVSITGSVRAGMAVAASAAKNLHRAHLELGGKAPAIVFADADIAATAEGVAGAGYFNAGQDCTAVTRVLVHESIHDEFVAELVKAAEATKTGDAEDPDAYYGPLNNASHFEKVSTVIESLPAHAKVVTGGHRVGDKGFYYAPTVITGVNQIDACVQEETFGPVLTVQTFSTEEQAIEMANDVPYALASSVWTSDHGTALRVSRDLDFGAVWINTHILLAAEMPHGGFKMSGYGKDLSSYGLEDYTRIKHVMSAL